MIFVVDPCDLMADPHDLVGAPHDLVADPHDPHDPHGLVAELHDVVLILIMRSHAARSLIHAWPTPNAFTSHGADTLSTHQLMDPTFVVPLGSQSMPKPLGSFSRGSSKPLSHHTPMPMPMPMPMTMHAPSHGQCFMPAPPMCSHVSPMHHQPVLMSTHVS